MTKKKKLAKLALKNPELFTTGELAYMQMWLEERKRLKSLKKDFKGFGGGGATNPVYSDDPTP